MTEGTYLMDRIRHKCTEDGDCLMWSGGLTSNSVPAIWLDGGRHPLRRLLWEEKNGPTKNGWRVGVSCGEARCISEDHLVHRPRSAELKGIKRSMSTRGKIAAAKRAQSPHAQVAGMIQASPKSTLELSQDLGIDYRTVAKIRSRTEYVNNPFAGLGAR